MPRWVRRPCAPTLCHACANLVSPDHLTGMSGLNGLAPGPGASRILRVADLGGMSMTQDGAGAPGTLEAAMTVISQQRQEIERLRHRLDDERIAEDLR